MGRPRDSKHVVVLRALRIVEHEQAAGPQKRPPRHQAEAAGPSIHSTASHDRPSVAGKSMYRPNIVRSVSARASHRRCVRLKKLRGGDGSSDGR